MGKGKAAEPVALQLDPRNVNRHTDASLGAVRRSVDRLGAGRSIVADSTGTLVAGEATYKAAQDLGIPIREVRTDGKELVVVIREDLGPDDPRRRALALADNQTAKLSEFDTDALVEQLRELDANQDLLRSTGFTDEQLREMLMPEEFGEPCPVESTEDRPATIPDRETLGTALFHALQPVDLERVVSFITDPVRETFEYADLLSGRSPACNCTSLLFNPHRLITKTSMGGDSVVDALGREKYCSGLARVALVKHWESSSRPTRSLLLACVEMGVNGVYYIQEFPPAVARDVVARYCTSRSARVLDPCAGWGGRMLGTSAVCNTYVGCEPSTKTVHGLQRLEEFIQRQRPEFRAIIHPQPYEDVDLGGESFDFAITSPPYFDTEDYADEDTQSAKRYPTFDDWREGFFSPMIRKTLKHLKRGCVFALNVGSRRYPLGQIVTEEFGNSCSIDKFNPFQGSGTGLGKEGKEGEVFYLLREK